VGDDLVNDVGGALAAGFGVVVWVERVPGELPDGAYLARQLAEVPQILGLGAEISNEVPLSSEVAHPYEG
jgi:hypothetical protein